MSLTNYRTLGRSGLRVSPLCLGSMTFGEDHGTFGASVATSVAMLDRYMGQGGNFIDTANFYTLGHAEKIIGDHVGCRPAKRDRLVIASKFFGNMHPGDPNGGGAGRKAMHAACDASLRRLQTDYIDLYWLHVNDVHTPIEETLLGMQDLVRAGKVRYIGFSDTPAWRVAQAQTLALLRGWSPLIGLQIEYSLLERTVEGELVPMAREMGLGITPWSPLKGGLLSGKYTRANQGKVDSSRQPMLSGAMGERTFALLDELTSIAQALGTTSARVALAWLSRQPGVVSPILGARTEAQLEDNLGALEIKLDAHQLERLTALSAPVLNFPAAFLNLAPTFMHGGMQVNGIDAPATPFIPSPSKPGY